MITQNLPTLKIHQLTDEQYKRVKESADYDPNALYLTPDDASGTANSLISAHNTATDAHADIRTALNNKLSSSELQTAINASLAQAKASGEFDGKDGQDGSPGKDGSNGVSATHSWNGTVLTVTSASGTSSADLKGATGNPGKDGSNGQPGTDGVSPTVAVSKSGKVTTVAITDKNGTKTVTINDGADGSPGSAGKDGTSVTVKSVSESTEDGGSNVVKFSDGKTLTVKNGGKGSPGDPGHTPQKGVDYWTPADQESIVQQVISDTGIEVVPDYVVTEAKPVIDRVIAAQGSRTFTFAVITDMHYGRNNYTDDVRHACQAIKYIGQRVKLDAIAVLGDYTDQYVTSNYTEGIRDFNDVNSMLSSLLFAPNLRQQGNHDFHTVHSPIVHKYVQGFSDDVVWGNKLGGYYYKDFADYKLRVISVNTTETTGESIGCYDAQYQWFADSLNLSAKEDASEWQILILSHHPLDWYTSDQNYRFGRILDAYTKGTSWSNGNVSCDFSEKNHARIVANIHGHLHNFKTDYVHIGNVADGNITEVVRMCMPESSAGGGNTYDGKWKEEITYAKTQNTAKDTSVTICCIDLDAYTINAVCYGAGYDRSVVYYDPAKPKYTNQLENAINSDGTPYRGTNGEIGYKVGYRLNSSGVETQNDDYCVTGFIPIKDYDYVYLKDMNFIIGDTTTQPNTRVVVYDSSFARKYILLANEVLSSNALKERLDESGGSLETGDALGRFRLYTESGDYYVRFSTKKIDDTSVVTVNEPIL